MVFTGTGHPGDSIIITDTGASISGATGFVQANGWFSISGNYQLSSGDQVSAHSGSAGGPSANIVIVSAAAAVTASALSTTISAGATIITVSGAPGSTVVISVGPPGVGPPPAQVLGTAVIPASGEVGVSLSQPVAQGATLTTSVGGDAGAPVVVAGGLAIAPVVQVGTVLAGNSVINGTGQPGATVQAVDSQGNVLGSTVVNAQGTFALNLSGATANQSVSIIENGVKAGPLLPTFALNAEKAFTNVNVFNPEKGGNLSIGFVAQTDGQVTVKVYNIAGSLVRPVFDTTCSAGQQYQANWDGKNGDGSTVASGVYFISVKGAGVRTIRKVVVLK
jgi:hypothetical protein